MSFQSRFFNTDVVAYEFVVVEQTTSQVLDSMLTPNAAMDRPGFDEFTSEIDEPGTYMAELFTSVFVWVSFTILPKPYEPVADETVEEAHEEETEVHVIGLEDGFQGFGPRLSSQARSDAQAMIGSTRLCCP